MPSSPLWSLDENCGQHLGTYRQDIRHNPVVYLPDLAHEFRRAIYCVGDDSREH